MIPDFLNIDSFIHLLCCRALVSQSWEPTTTMMYVAAQRKDAGSEGAPPGCIPAVFILKNINCHFLKALENRETKPGKHVRHQAKKARKMSRGLRREALRRREKMKLRSIIKNQDGVIKSIKSQIGSLVEDKQLCIEVTLKHVIYCE